MICHYVCGYAGHDSIQAKCQKRYQLPEERKRLDGLNTIIYGPTHSDDMVIFVAIMSVIIIFSEKDFYLEFM